MTDALSRWKAHRQSCHMETDSELLGDELAKENENLRAALSAMLERTIIYCGGDDLPFAGRSDAKLISMAIKALQSQ